MLGKFYYTEVKRRQKKRLYSGLYVILVICSTNYCTCNIGAVIYWRDLGVDNLNHILIILCCWQSTSPKWFQQKLVEYAEKCREKQLPDSGQSSVKTCIFDCNVFRTRSWYHSGCGFSWNQWNSIERRSEFSNTYPKWFITTRWQSRAIRE